MSLRRIGTVLSEMRSRKGRTQVDLAKKAKVSQAYIARMESGDKKNLHLPLFSVSPKRSAYRSRSCCSKQST